MKRVKIIAAANLLFLSLAIFAWSKAVAEAPKAITISILAMDGTPVIFDYFANGKLVEEARLNGTTNVFSEYAAKSSTDPTMDMEIDWIEILTKKAYRLEFTIDPKEIEYFDRDSKRINISFYLGPNGEVDVYYTARAQAQGNAEDTRLFHGCAPKVGMGDEIFQEFREYRWGSGYVSVLDKTIQDYATIGKKLENKVVVNCEDDRQSRER